MLTNFCRVSLQSLTQVEVSKRNLGSSPWQRLSVIVLSLVLVACAKPVGWTTNSGPSAGQDLETSSQPTLMGHREGNGGDNVRHHFLEMGKMILQMLDSHESGKTLVKNFGLNTNQLRQNLTIEKILVTEDILRDNQGVHVEARFDKTRGVIELSRPHWQEHFDKNRDVYYLVFHEMLRLAGINDDNYKISSALSPFPVSFQRPSRRPGFSPLVSNEQLKGVIDLLRIQLSGDGCNQEQKHTFVELDTEQNTLEVTPLNFNLLGVFNFVGDIGATSDCQIEIPIKLPVGTRLTATQIDIHSGITLGEADRYEIDVTTDFGHTPSQSHQKFVAPPHTQAVTIGRSLTRFAARSRSQCTGSEQTLKISTKATLHSNWTSLMSQSFATVDKIKVYFETESCGPSGGIITALEATP